ncbi:MAG TPA: diguanylate cyclase [Albitalea sp.]|uniref:GGDEF domain-containing protein n=1 Tax=Piscinibacter sp. TaxID=1903157 RepID=UPI002ED24E06
MPGSQAVQVPVVFARLQRAVHALEVPGLPPGRRITFSMGVAEAWSDNDGVAEVIHRADEALYRAKQNGRDRCETAPRLRLAVVAPTRARESLTTSSGL